MVEPIQGEAGVVVPSEGYLKGRSRISWALAKSCKDSHYYFTHVMSRDIIYLFHLTVCVISAFQIWSMKTHCRQQACENYAPATTCYGSRMRFRPAWLARDDVCVWTTRRSSPTCCCWGRRCQVACTRWEPNYILLNSCWNNTRSVLGHTHSRNSLLMHLLPTGVGSASQRRSHANYQAWRTRLHLRRQPSRLQGWSLLWTFPLSETRRSYCRFIFNRGWLASNLNQI